MKVIKNLFDKDKKIYQTLKILKSKSFLELNWKIDQKCAWNDSTTWLWKQF